MGNYHSYYTDGWKFEPIDNPTIPKHLNKYLNKCGQNYQRSTGNSKHCVNDHCKNLKEEIISWEDFNNLDDNIQEKICDISWDRRPSTYSLGAWNYGQGSIELLKMWEQGGIYKKLNVLGSDSIYNFDSITCKDDTLCIPMKDDPHTKICFSA